jgi:hypothetical protein
MKTPTKNSAKCSWLIFPILVVALFWTAGCATQTPDPLAGWRVVSDHDPDKIIVKDYQDYIEKLPPKKRDHVGIIFFLEDGSGQHAVSIEIWETGNTSWHYALIYNKENKRIKVVKYGYRRVMS